MDNKSDLERIIDFFMGPEVERYLPPIVAVFLTGAIIWFLIYISEGH